MNTLYIQILIALIPGILISFLTAFLTVGDGMGLSFINK